MSCPESITSVVEDESLLLLELFSYIELQKDSPGFHCMFKLDNNRAETGSSLKAASNSKSDTLQGV